MADWAALQGIGQTLWEWGTKLGLGGVGGWWLKRLLDQRDRAVERGRARVDAAQPELAPRNNHGTQYVVQLEVENRGKGPARTRRLGFTGVQEVATLDEIPAGQARITAALNVQGSPLFDPASDGHAEITLVYVDKYENEYRLRIPVMRAPRADGGFNMVIDWHNVTNETPTPSKARLREIGG